jgi:hypothetical protein
VAYEAPSGCYSAKNAFRAHSFRGRNDRNRYLKRFNKFSGFGRTSGKVEIAFLCLPWSAPGRKKAEPVYSRDKKITVMTIAPISGCGPGSRGPRLERHGVQEDGEERSCNGLNWKMWKLWSVLFFP